MKSTPINQLPTKTNDNDDHVEKYVNNNTPTNQLKLPIDTSVNMNIDDDISINDVMSELNDNRSIELNESTRLQQQINMLQNEIENQKRHNDNMINQNVYVPQSAPGSASASASAAATKNTDNEQVGIFSNILSSFGIKKLISSIDFILFIIVCVTSFVLYSNTVDDFIGKYIKDSKYYFVKDPMKSIILGIIVCLYTFM